MTDSIDILIDAAADEGLKLIAKKVKNSERISDNECLLLFEKGSLAFVGALANLFVKDCTAIEHISTATFILSPPMFVCSVANSVRTPACMHIRKKAGN